MSVSVIRLFSVVSVVLQVFDNTPAALDGTLAAGDEITGVNGKPVKGKTKVEVAKMIQAVQVHNRLERSHSHHSFTTHILLKYRVIIIQWIHSTHLCSIVQCYII